MAYVLKPVILKLSVAPGLRNHWFSQCTPHPGLMHFTVCCLGWHERKGQPCLFLLTINQLSLSYEPVFRHGYRHIFQEQIIFFSKGKLKTKFSKLSINLWCCGLVNRFILYYKTKFLTFQSNRLSRELAIRCCLINAWQKQSLPEKKEDRLFSWNSLAVLNFLKDKSLTSNLSYSPPRASSHFV